jgi:uncharacterized protein YfkK (UPF0435 family)
MSTLVYIDVKDNIPYAFGYEYEDSSKRTNSPQKFPATIKGYTDKFKDGYANIKRVIYITSKSKDFNTACYDILAQLFKYPDVKRINLLTPKLSEVLYYFLEGPKEFGINDNSFQSFKSDTTNTIRELIKDVEIENIVEINPLVSSISKAVANGIKYGAFQQDTIIEVDGKDYWKKFEYKNPLMFGKYTLIDRTSFKEDGKYKLLSVQYPSAEEISRKLLMVNESVIYTNDIPEEVLDIIENMFDFLQTDSRLFIIDLGVINDNITLRLTKDFGLGYIRDFKRAQQYLLKGITGQILAYTIYPPGLSNKLLDSVKYLTSDDYNTLDITDLIYDNNDGKLTIKKDIKQSKHVLNIKLDVGTIVLLLGIDTLPRNVFKRLEKDNPRVYVGYKLEENIISYRTRIVTDKDICYSYSPYNSQTLRKRVKK